MKKFAVTLLVLSVFGCATDARLREENARLQQELEAVRGISASSAAPIGRGAAPRAGVGRMPMMMAPAPMGPPQSYGQMYRPIRGCEEGPLALEIVNQTEFYLKVFLDGQEVTVNGGGGVLPYLPPQTGGGSAPSVYVCLNEQGKHSINGIAFSCNIRGCQQSGKFSTSNNYGIVRGFARTHYLMVDKYMLR